MQNFKNADEIVNIRKVPEIGVSLAFDSGTKFFVNKHVLFNNTSVCKYIFDNFDDFIKRHNRIELFNIRKNKLSTINHWIVVTIDLAKKLIKDNEVIVKINDLYVWGGLNEEIKFSDLYKNPVIRKVYMMMN